MQRIIVRAGGIGSWWGRRPAALGLALALWAGGIVLAVEPARSQQARSSARLALSVPGEVQLAPGTEVAFQISVRPLDAVPPNSFIRIRGLPRGAKLSEGHAVATGIWAVPLSALDELSLAYAGDPAPRMEINVALMTLDGAILAEQSVALMTSQSGAGAAKASPAPPAALPPAPPPTVRPPISLPGKAVAPSLPAPAPPAPTPPPPALKPPGEESAQRTRPITERGLERMKQGDIVGARLFFQRAADMGDGEAALALGMTFDPAELRRMGAVGVKPDPAAAAMWYEKAHTLGAREAEARLKRLSGR